MDSMMVNGVRIGYELSGSGREAVVFLNGIAMSVAHWKLYVEAFAPRYRCLCHDFRGQLMSDRPAGPYSFPQHADDLAALMKKLGIDRAHIVGTSYGSEVGMVFAIEHPEMTASLTVIDGVSELDGLLRSAAEGWRAASLASPAAMYRNLIPWTYSNAYIAANKEALVAREAALASFPADYFTGFADLCTTFLALAITDELPKITCPTLVLVGSEDILKPVKYSEIIVSKIPGAKMKVLPGLGHASVVEAPRTIIGELEAFLK